MSTANVLAFLSDLQIPGVYGQRRFGDVMADFQRERFEALAPALMAVVNGERPPIGRYLWDSTKSTSKDSDIAAALLYVLTFANRPARIQVVAADQDQADETADAMRQIIRLNPMLINRFDIQRRRIVSKTNGARLEIIASDVAGTHGARPDVVVINELSHIQKQEVAQNFLDNAGKMPNSLAIIATNAGFTGTWQWKWREMARTSARWYFHRLDRPAPWIDPAEIEEAKQRNPESRYLRLWWGQWVSGSGDALDPSDVDAAFTLPGPTNHCEPSYRYYGGLDVGWKRDRTGWAVVGRHLKTNRIKLVKIRSWEPNKATGEVHLPDVMEAIAKDYGLYHMAKSGADPHQAALLMQLLKKRGVPLEEVPFTGARLNDMASVVLESFRSRLIDLYGEQLKRDLSRLVIEEKAYGFRLSSTRDADGHADLATALTIALLVARNAKHGKPLMVAGGGESETPPPAATDREEIIHLGEYRPGAFDRIRQLYAER